MDGNGGCCIARWTDGGPVVSGSKMDMIMLKFRPIAPKPVSPTATPDSTNNSPRDAPHAKGPTRGRRKNNNNNNNNNNNSKKVGRKRKSNSPENRTAEMETETETVGGGITLLPLFPEAPDLSPTKQQQDINNNNNNVPIWVNFNNGYNTNNTLGFENNYGNCQGYGW